MDTGSTLTPFDKEKPDFLVRLLTESSSENDAFRENIYDKLYEASTPEEALKIITNEHILTAIANKDIENGKILNEAVPLMLLVFKDFKDNKSKSTFDSIVKTMSETIEEIVEVVDTPDAIDEKNSFKKTVEQYVQEEKDYDRRNKALKPRNLDISKTADVRTIGSVLSTAEPAPASVPVPGSSVPVPESSVRAPEPTTLATSAAPEPEASTGSPPTKSDDPLEEIYTNALGQITSRLDKINIFASEESTSNLYTIKFSDTDIFNSEYFFDDLTREEDAITKSITTFNTNAGFTETNLNTIKSEITKFIVKVNKLNKIKEVVRNLEIDSKIYLFQFLFLQTTKNLSKNVTIIEEANNKISKIEEKRRDVINFLISKQQTAEKLINLLRKVIRPDSKQATKKDKTIENKQFDAVYNNKEKIITALSEDFKNVLKLSVLKDLEEKTKTPVFTNLITHETTIKKQDNPELSNLQKNIKIDILNKIREKTAAATKAATKAVTLYNRRKDNMSIMSIIQNLEFFDQVTLARQLVEYVNKILNEILDNSKGPKFTATKFTDLLDDSILLIKELDSLKRITPSVTASSSGDLMPSLRVESKTNEQERFEIMIGEIEAALENIYTNDDLNADPYKIDKKGEQIMSELSKITELIKLWSGAIKYQNDNNDKIDKTNKIKLSLIPATIKEIVQKIVTAGGILFKNFVSADQVNGQIDAIVTKHAMDNNKEVALGALNNLLTTEMEKEFIILNFFDEIEKYDNFKDTLDTKKITNFESIKLLKDKFNITEQDITNSTSVAPSPPPPPPMASASPPVSPRPLASTQIATQNLSELVSKFELAIKAAEGAFKRLDDKEQSIKRAIIPNDDVELRNFVKAANIKVNEAESILNTEIKMIADKGDFASQITDLERRFTDVKININTVFDINESAFTRAQRATGFNKTSTPRVPRDPGETIADIIRSSTTVGGTRRGGKRFHKKTIKKNLVHKKTFKKNIVHNKIVHKKTSKNNIVKNNIVNKKTIRKNYFKRKQTHKK